MFIYEAFQQWQSDIAPMVAKSYGENDRPALAESWNNYVDQMEKNGSIPTLAATHCPAHDDDENMPGNIEEEIDVILEAMGFSYHAVKIAGRSDAAAGWWAEYASHYHVTVARGKRAAVGFEYSKGAALADGVTLIEAVMGVARDANSLADGDTFEDWAESVGLDEDSRKAYAVYEDTKRIQQAFMRMVTDDELLGLMQYEAEL